MDKNLLIHLSLQSISKTYNKLPNH